MKVVLKKKGENRKLIALGVLVVIASVLLYSGGSDNPASPSSGSAAPQTAVPAQESPALAARPHRGIASRGSAEFRPVLHSPRPEDRIDPTKVDPTLKLTLLAKVQAVTLEGGSRNLFQFGVAPAPAAAALGPIPKENKIAVNRLPAPPAAPEATGPTPVPPPPAIPLKYYGFSNARGEPRKKAFFLDGEDIIVAWEGETVKSRYKVVHIGVNSVDVEDTQFKNKQTLPMAEEVAG
ncbi:MAG: hypothetical protein M3Z09_14710 [Acidobacteriota bacterium]|nr:hypothetical protein [Acidobacteriota bacterium]